MRQLGFKSAANRLSIKHRSCRTSGAVSVSLIAAFEVAMLVCSMGCSEEDCCILPPPPPFESRFRARTSPENLLHNLKEAYAERDIAQVESLLAPDFTFVFTPYDQAQPNIPDSWNRGAEIEAHLGMFDGRFVQTLSMQFDDAGHAVVDPEFTAPGDTAWVVVVTAMNLELFGTPRRIPDEPPQTFKVQDGEALFWFKRLAHTDPETGDPIWIIFRCQETTTINPKGTLPTDNISWGNVKAIFKWGGRSSDLGVEVNHAGVRLCCHAQVHFG